MEIQVSHVSCISILCAIEVRLPRVAITEEQMLIVFQAYVNAYKLTYNPFPFRNFYVYPYQDLKPQQTVISYL